MPLVHFVHFDIQLTKMNKPVNKEKKIGFYQKIVLPNFLFASSETMRDYYL